MLRKYGFTLRRQEFGKITFLGKIETILTFVNKISSMELSTFIEALENLHKSIQHQLFIYARS
jgi:hypothetical protein